MGRSARLPARRLCPYSAFDRCAGVHSCPVTADYGLRGLLKLV